MTVKADFQGWLEQITARLLAQPVAISPAIASEVAALPDTFHCDPGDRATVTSARVMDATLLTQDPRIVQAGLVPTL